jgi:hypothetical protein
MLLSREVPELRGRLVGMGAAFASLPGSDPRGDVLVSWAERTARGDRLVAGLGTLRWSRSSLTRGGGGTRS